MPLLADAHATHEQSVAIVSKTMAPPSGWIVVRRKERRIPAQSAGATASFVAIACAPSRHRQPKAQEEARTRVCPDGPRVLIKATLVGPRVPIEVNLAGPRMPIEATLAGPIIPIEATIADLRAVIVDTPVGVRHRPRHRRRMAAYAQPPESLWTPHVCPHRLPSRPSLAPVGRHDSCIAAPTAALRVHPLRTLLLNW